MENYLLLLEEYDYQTPPEVARDAAQAIQQAMVASDVFTTFVFQPGGVAAANVYTSWAALYAAMNTAAPPSATGSRPPTRIHIDDSFTSPAIMPAGAYNLDNVTLSGQANFNASSGGALLQLADGVTLTGPALGWTLTITSTLEVVYVGTHTCITIGAGAELNLYLSQGAYLRCSAAGTFCLLNGAGYVLVCAVNEVEIESLAAGGPVFDCAGAGGAIEVQNIGDVRFGDGVHNALVQTAGTATVLGRAGSNIAAQACLGTVAVTWDDVIPRAQGAGVTVTQIGGYVPATPGNWHPAPTTQSGALDQLASTLQNHVQGIQAFTGPAAAAINTVNLAHTTTTGHTRCFGSVSVTCASADADIGFQLAIDGVGTGPVMGASGTLAGDAVTCAIEWDFAPAAGAHNYTMLVTSGAAGALTGVQSCMKVQELSG